MKVLIAGIVWLLIAVGCFGATITVDDDGPADFNNIQAAIDSASDNDVIEVLPGTYTGTGNRHLELNGLAITVCSAKGPQSCIIDAESADMVFYLVHESSSAVIRGFTITGGDNTSAYGGGGIYIHQSHLTVDDCIIKENNSDKGGGLCVWISSATISNCTFESNTAESNGAGMYTVNCPGLNISNCIFRANVIGEPYNHGGAVYNENGSVDLVNCLFEGNKAYRSGGAMFNAGCSVSLVNCALFGNHARFRGGAAFLTSASYLEARNCIFINNTADNGGDEIYLADAGSSFNFSYCDIDQSGIEGLGTVDDAGGNINVDPDFVSVGYWNLDNWVAGDYHLKSKVGRWNIVTAGWTQDNVQSQCIDAGDTNDAVGDEPAPNGGIVNVGFYGSTSQASKSPYCSEILPSDLNGDCHVDVLDFSFFAGQWLECRMIPPEFCWQ